MFVLQSCCVYESVSEPKASVVWQTLVPIVAAAAKSGEWQCSVVIDTETLSLSVHFHTYPMMQGWMPTTCQWATENKGVTLTALPSALLSCRHWCLELAALAGQAPSLAWLSKMSQVTFCQISCQIKTSTSSQRVRMLKRTVKRTRKV